MSVWSTRPMRSVRLVVLVALVRARCAGVRALVAAAPPRPPSTRATLIPCSKADEAPVTVTVSSVLDPSCRCRGGLNHSVER